jgi:hypothetical protein
MQTTTAETAGFGRGETQIPERILRHTREQVFNMDFVEYYESRFSSFVFLMNGNLWTLKIFNDEKDKTKWPLWSD